MYLAMPPTGDRDNYIIICVCACAFVSVHVCAFLCSPLSLRMAVHVFLVLVHACEVCLYACPCMTLASFSCV